MKTPPLRPITAAALAALAFSVPASAQTIVNAPASTLPSTVATGSGRTASALGSPAILNSDLPLFRRGPVTVRPHTHYRFIYGEGIEAGPGNPRDTTIQSIAPGVLFDLGTSWHFDYTPTWTFYSNAAFRDTFDQVAGLSGHVSYGPWVFGGSQSYETSHAMLVETGRQTRQEKLSTSVNAVWKIGQRTQADLTLSRSVRYANALTEAPEWTTSDWLQHAATGWLRYQISPRLDLAAGLSWGFADLSVGDDMTFTQPQLQLTWRPTDKVSLAVQAGRENRTFGGTNDASLSTPIYSASFGYQLFTVTKLMLEASRSISASYFANEITKSAGWSAGVQQRFIQRLQLEARYSENAAHYIGTRALLLTRRDDTYRSYSLRLSTALFRRSSFAVLYQGGRNTSNDQAYAFATHQYGCEFSHRF